MKNKIVDIIDIFERIPSEYIYLESPASVEEIANFERKINFPLPQEFIDLLKFHNGINLMGAVILGVPTNNGLAENLESVYDFEHFEAGNPMPLHLIPFSPDGGGNHYCFDVHSNTIVFWNSEYDYSIVPPEIVYNSLYEMLKEVFVEWTIKEDEDISFVLE